VVPLLADPGEELILLIEQEREKPLRAESLDDDSLRHMTDVALTHLAEGVELGL
jgi:hypothetical protein